MTDGMIDAPVYVDWALALVLMVSAIIQYIWIGFHGHTFGRWLQALGFTGLSVRLIWSLVQGYDPHIAAVSIGPLAGIATGSSITAIQQMRLLWTSVRCIQAPEHRCFREDRVKQALREKGNGLS